MVHFTNYEIIMLLAAIKDHEPTNDDTEYFTSEREGIEKSKKDIITKLNYSLIINGGGLANE